jgi:hypothetical protein
MSHWIGEICITPIEIIHINRLLEGTIIELRVELDYLSKEAFYQIPSHLIGAIGKPFGMGIISRQIKKTQRNLVNL